MTSNTTPRAVSVAILKGGVGKSTIAVNLTERLAAHGHRALFIDLDPNGHATMGLGRKELYQSEEDISDVVLEEGGKDPTDIIYETEFDFDIIPSSSNLESVEDGLRNATMGDVRLRKNLIEPLLNSGQYDYIVTDTPAYRGKLADNALIGTQNMIIPLVPGNEALAGLERTMERQIQPLRRHIDLNILAITPNRLSTRIDQQTNDRRLVENLNSQDHFAKYVPDYARITPDEFEQIDNGNVTSLPKPGIRDRDAFTYAFGENQPLAYYDPDNDQLDCLNELATIVEQGGISR